MRLDPEKCPVGTVGFLPPGGVDEFADADDFGWFKEPSVVLTPERNWESIDPRPLEHTFGEAPLGKAPEGASVETVVFGDWKSAVLYAIERERTEATKRIEDAEQDIREARATIGHAADVERWVYRSK